MPDDRPATLIESWFPFVTVDARSLRAPGRSIHRLPHMSPASPERCGLSPHNDVAAQETSHAPSPTTRRPPPTAEDLRFHPLTRQSIARYALPAQTPQERSNLRHKRVAYTPQKQSKSRHTTI